MANPYYIAPKRTESEVGDIIYIETTSNDAGKYQVFFRDNFKIALESSSSPTIPDSNVEA